MKAMAIGGAMIDTIAIIESERIEHVTLRNTAASFLLLEEGRKTEALEISTHCGGGAVNASVAMARLGLDVAVMVKVGRDSRAETILNRLMSEGVSTRWVVRDARLPTGASVHVSSHERNAAIFTFRGANTLLDAADLRREAFASDMIYVSGLSGGSAHCFAEIVERGKANGALIVANPGILQLTDRQGALYRALDRVDVLIINRTEANALVPELIRLHGSKMADPATRKDRLYDDERPLAGGGFELGLQEFFRSLMALGPSQVVMTDGSAGAYLATEERILFCPVIESDVKGTAGAGDAFGATFASYLVMGRDAEDAIRAAAVNAASVTQFVDTQSGLKSLESLDRSLSGARERLALRSWPTSTSKNKKARPGGTPR